MNVSGMAGINTGMVESSNRNVLAGNRWYPNKNIFQTFVTEGFDQFPYHDVTGNWQNPAYRHTLRVSVVTINSRFHHGLFWPENNPNHLYIPSSPNYTRPHPLRRFRAFGARDWIGIDYSRLLTVSAHFFGNLFFHYRVWAPCGLPVSKYVGAYRMWMCMSCELCKLPTLPFLPFLCAGGQALGLGSALHWGCIRAASRMGQDWREERPRNNTTMSTTRACASWM